MADRFEMGSVVTLRGEFRTPKTAVPANALIDPTIVTLRVQAPDKIVTVYTFGTDPEVIQDSTGKYSFPLLLAQEGTYYWRWKGDNGPSAIGVVTGTLDSRREPNF